VYAYEKSQPGRETNHTQTLKFKNKYNIKTKAALRNLPKDDLSSSKRNRSKNRYANIDSYFDLSCLETCTPKSRLG
jgi:protein tyrosine phosphatase